MTCAKSSKMERKACKRRVSFNQVEIIELPYTIGDGPASGTPVTVEWKAQDRTSFRLDFFEQYRPQRRSRTALRLSADTRSQILLRSGHSWEDICAGANEAAKLRKERTISLQQICTIQEIRNLQVAKAKSRIPPSKPLQHNFVHARMA